MSALCKTPAAAIVGRVVAMLIFVAVLRTKRLLQ
jgi:hypothetical protein